MSHFLFTFSTILVQIETFYIIYIISSPIPLVSLFCYLQNSQNCIVDNVSRFPDLYSFRALFLRRDYFHSIELRLGGNYNNK